MESTFSSLALGSTPWMLPKHIPTSLKTHPLIGPTLRCFKAACKRFNISSITGPLTPINDNPVFPSGKGMSLTFHNWPFPSFSAFHLFENGNFLSLPQLADKMTNKIFPPGLYQQLQLWMGDLNQNNQISRPLSFFESLCSLSSPQRHVVSLVHNTFFQQPTVNNCCFRKAWERDLNLQFSDSEWGKILTLTHKGSTNVSTQENNFKIVSRWYRTPSVIHKFYPSLPDTCWRCHKGSGSLIHIWWACPSLQPFWRQVHKLTNQISSSNLEFLPTQLLLHFSSLPVSVYRSSLPLHLLNAAKLCIPTHWGSTIIPSLSEWFNRIDKIAKMEELIHISKDSPTKFYKTWAAWLSFRNSSHFTASLQPSIHETDRQSCS